jgi:hypothetical protein
MTSASERHGLKHYSASTCNLFQADAALFVMEKLMGIRGPVGCAAHRGTAAEAGIAAGLLDPTKPLPDCQQLALAEFDRLAALSTDPRREAEREAVPGLVEQGLLELRPYGVPSHTQHRIEWQHPDLPLPFVGFVDFMWADHGIIVDLKTQLRLSSEIANNHARQVALYAGSMGDNYDGRVAYVTPKKAATYRVENMRAHVAALVRIAQTIERFLALAPTAEELARIVVPNVDSYFYSDRNTRQKAFEIFGV